MGGGGKDGGESRLRGGDKGAVAVTALTQVAAAVAAVAKATRVVVVTAGAEAMVLSLDGWRQAAGWASGKVGSRDLRRITREIRFGACGFGRGTAARLGELAVVAVLNLAGFELTAAGLFANWRWRRCFASWRGRWWRFEAWLVWSGWRRRDIASWW